MMTFVSPTLYDAEQHSARVPSGPWLDVTGEQQTPAPEGIGRQQEFCPDIYIHSPATSPPLLAIPISSTPEPLPLDDEKAKERHFLQCDSSSFSQLRNAFAFLRTFTHAK